jgi:chemotaxis protein MotB
LARRNQMIEEQARLLSDLRGGRAGLEAQLAALDARFAGLRFGDLDPTTDSALRELAAQYGDILEYDSARGMLRFKSDLTFASGSDQLNESVKGALGKLGQILNSAAANYEVRVVGHTDTQRVRQLPGRSFKNNIELSAFRSISVRNYLVDNGVAPQRFEVAGRGEFDPIVANTGSGNTPQNRRVEIFLGRPMGGAGSSVTTVPDTVTDAPVRQPAREEIMK